MLKETEINALVKRIFDEISFTQEPAGLYDPLRYMIEIGGNISAVSHNENSFVQIFVLRKNNSTSSEEFKSHIMFLTKKKQKSFSVNAEKTHLKAL